MVTYAKTIIQASKTILANKNYRLALAIFGIGWWNFKLPNYLAWASVVFSATSTRTRIVSAYFNAHKIILLTFDLFSNYTSVVERN